MRGLRSLLAAVALLLVAVLQQPHPAAGAPALDESDIMRRLRQLANEAGEAGTGICCRHQPAGRRGGACSTAASSLSVCCVPCSWHSVPALAAQHGLVALIGTQRLSHRPARRPVQEAGSQVGGLGGGRPRTPLWLAWRCLRCKPAGDTHVSVGGGAAGACRHAAPLAAPAMLLLGLHVC